jgi:hypothetical protein
MKVMSSLNDISTERLGNRVVVSGILLNRYLIEWFFLHRGYLFHESVYPTLHK